MGEVYKAREAKAIAGRFSISASPRPERRNRHR
jgi:hypothetical protein